MALPVIICLKSAHTNEYLNYLDHNLLSNGLLRFSGEQFIEPAAQFEVVDSQTGRGLIHIKSSYNNKFFVRWSPMDYWIAAASDEPNENLNDSSCTLFRPEIIEDNGTTMKIRLMHAQLGIWTSITSRTLQRGLSVKSGFISNFADIFIVFDCSYFSKLPKNVAFKGDNGKYLGVSSSNGKSHFQFSFDDHNDPKVVHEVISSSNGTMYLKSKFLDQFWRLDDDNMIVADGTDLEDLDHIAKAMFRPKFIDVNVVALLNMQRTWYVKRFTNNDMVDLLSASTSSVDESAKLQVIDLGE